MHAAKSLLCLCFFAVAVSASDPPEKAMIAGRLADAETALQGVLTVMPKADQARFGLGMVQVGRAVEKLGQGLYRYGFHFEEPWNYIGVRVPLPIPKNPNPSPVDYVDLRNLARAWVEDLAKADATLAGVTDPDVKLPLNVGQVKFDFTGQGPGVALFEILRQQNIRPTKNDADLLVCFDRGDVAWLRGYCHLMMALGEIVLAYDERELFEIAAHVHFAKPKTPLAGFVAEEGGRRNGYDGFVDLIAAVHATRFPLAEPERMKTALGHLEQTVAFGKEMWKHILAETDDDHEWIPNPKQTSQFNVRVSESMVSAWLATLDEFDNMLQGKRLAPFWRGSGHGFNVRRFFTEPRTFDFVLWVQGAGAVPYLEKGDITRREVWNRLEQVLRGDIFWFAAWVN